MAIYEKQGTKGRTLGCEHRSFAAVVRDRAGGHGHGLRAEVKEVILGQQFGAVYLPAMVMEGLQLVEKQLAADGMGDVKVTWAKLGGPAAINDGLLSGNLHFGCQGIPSLAVIWDRTRGGIAVKALGALASNNAWLNTRNANVKSLKDFTEKDRIAIPSLKVSSQAIWMHIAAEQVWGKGNHTKLDHIIVALPHPDALAAVSARCTRSTRILPPRRFTRRR